MKRATYGWLLPLGFTTPVPKRQSYALCRSTEACRRALEPMAPTILLVIIQTNHCALTAMKNRSVADPRID